MEVVSSPGKMDVNTQENMLRIRRKDKASLLGLMEEYMKANGI